MDTRAVLWRPQDKAGGLLSVIHTLSQSRKPLPLEVGPLPRARLQRGHADLSGLFCYLMPTVTSESKLHLRAKSGSMARLQPRSVLLFKVYVTIDDHAGA